MANPKEWGPIIWKIIHTTVEHLGNHTNILLQNDEIHAYKKFIQQVLHILPCKICKIHYKKHLLNHKKDLQYSELKNYAKEFFYTIHDSVNREKNSVSIVFSDLESVYGSITKEQFRNILQEFEACFQKYKLYHYISSESIHDFITSLIKLRRSCSWI